MIMKKGENTNMSENEEKWNININESEENGVIWKYNDNNMAIMW